MHGRIYMDNVENKPVQQHPHMVKASVRVRCLHTPLLAHDALSCLPQQSKHPAPTAPIHLQSHGPISKGCKQRSAAYSPKIHAQLMLKIHADLLLSRLANRCCARCVTHSMDALWFCQLQFCGQRLQLLMASAPPGRLRTPAGSRSRQMQCHIPGQCAPRWC